jgi:hypothetical protein
MTANKQIAHKAGASSVLKAGYAAADDALR